MNKYLLVRDGIVLSSSSDYSTEARKVPGLIAENPKLFIGLYELVVDYKYEVVAIKALNSPRSSGLK